MALRQLERVSGGRLQFLREMVTMHPGLDEAGLEKVLGDFARGRFVLALDFLRAAQSVAAQDRGSQIMVVSRAYYAMYQSARAVVFAARRADVHRHEDVREQLPDDLPDRQEWRNALERWHKRRNDFDYSPYPPEGDLLPQRCSEAVWEVSSFLRACREYLLGRGVKELPNV